MPPCVRVTGLAFAYEGRPSVFQDISFHITGLTALVGANGCGKTTLLRLLSGELSPTAGAVALDPADALVVTCRQTVDELSPHMVALAEAWDRRAVRTQARLALEPEQLERWSQLSPGERKRWQIGGALYAEPDVLLLDEPTNHLDAGGRARLTAALGSFRGVAVVVSHDRTFLDDATDATLRLRAGSLHSYPGGYVAARAQWRAEERADADRYERASRQQRALRRRLADERRDRGGAESKLSSRSRMRGPKDSDARSTAAKARAQNGEAAMSRRVSTTRAALERAGDRLAALSVHRQGGRSLIAHHDEGSAPPIIMALDLPALVAGNAVLVEQVKLAVERTSRMRVCGPNGCGKTTLLEALLSSAGRRRHRITYVQQQLTVTRVARLRESLIASEHRQRILDTASALDLDPGRVVAGDPLSPGEARKLAIALGLATDAWGMVLDEPTNHLDIPSIERLQDVLSDYAGALLLVTHDAMLGEAVTDQAWELRDRRLERLA